MPKKWSEVSESPQFQALAPEAKEAARSQYFDQVVAPRVPREKLEFVRSQFDSETSFQPKAPAPQVEAPSGGGLGKFLMGQGEDAIERGAAGAVATIPYGGRIQKMLKGEDAYPEPAGIERSGAMIGDASQALLTGATAGRGLGLGMALNAGLEASGVNPLARKIGRGAVVLNDKVRHDFPSKMLGVEGLGTAANFWQQFPGETVDLAANLAPAVLAGAKVSKSQGAKQAASTAKAAPMMEALDDLKDQGGEAPISSNFGTGKLRDLAGSVERGAKMDPLTQGKYVEIDAKNGQAASKFFQQTFGQDILGPVKEGIGTKMEGILNNLVERRADKYEPALTELKKAGKTKGFGQMMANDLRKAVGESYVVDQVSGPFAKFIQEIEGMDDPRAIDKKLTSMRLKFKQDNADKLGKVDTQLDRDYGVLAGAAKDAYYKGLDLISGGLDNKIRVKPMSEGTPLQGPSGGLGSRMREAKGDYAADSKPIGELSEILQAKSSPEFVMQAVFQSGAKPVRQLFQALTPAEKKLFQKEAGRWLVDQAKDAKTGNVSASNLSKIPVKYRDILPAIFDDSHGKSVLGYIQRGTNLLKAANIDELGSMNPSGSGSLLGRSAHNPAQIAGNVAAGGLAGAMYGQSLGSTLGGAALGLAAPIVKGGIDLGYTHGLPAVLKGAKAINQAPSRFTPEMPKSLRASGKLANILRAKQQQEEAERLQR